MSEANQYQSMDFLHAESKQLSRNAARAELMKQGISEEKFSNELALAAEAGDSKLVHLLIAAGADVNWEHEEGRTPLLAVAHSKSGNVEIMRALIAAGADVNRPNKYACFPIELACTSGYVDRVRELIAAGANVNVKNQYGSFPLELAAEKGHSDCLTALIDAGANIDESNKIGCTALMGASLCGRVECVKVLLAAGANINAVNTFGWSPLRYAVSRGHTDCLRVLLAAGADAGLAAYDDKTPLDWAVECEHEDCIALLKAAAEGKQPVEEEDINEKAQRLYRELFSGGGLMFDVIISEEEDLDELRRNPDVAMLRESLSHGPMTFSWAYLTISGGRYDKLGMLRLCLAAGAEVYRDKNGEVMVRLPAASRPPMKTEKTVEPIVRPAKVGCRQTEGGKNLQNPEPSRKLSEREKRSRGCYMYAILFIVAMLLAVVLLTISACG